MHVCLLQTGKEERRKWVTVDKEALLAFVYYDTTHTGYIEDKDLEDMFYTLGMQVSRAQVCYRSNKLRYTFNQFQFTNFNSLEDTISIMCNIISTKSSSKEVLSMNHTRVYDSLNISVAFNITRKFDERSMFS